MAAIENLKINVDVDIASAVAALEELQDELHDVAAAIESVDTQGSEGIDIRTSVDDLDTELAKLAGEIEAFEAAESIDIPMDVHDRGFQEILARAGFSSMAGLGGDFRDPMHAGFAGADLDFGGFNVPRGQGIDRADASMFGRSLRRLRRRFHRLRDTLDDFDIRMSDIHNLLATLVPLLVVFIATLPAVITALVGLAGAALVAAASLAAIAGFGAMGFAMVDGEFQMERLTDVWETIREDFIDAFAPLAEQLQPIFEDAIEGLGRLFQAIANEGSALTELTDLARGFGSFVMDFLPDALRTLSAFLEALAPALANIGRAIDQQFNHFMRELARLTMEALPAVSGFIQALVNAIPALVEISIQFTRVAGLIVHMIGLLWRIITVNGVFTDQVAALSAIALVAASVLALFGKILAGLSGALLIRAAQATWGYIVALYEQIAAALGASVANTTLASSLFTASGALAAFLTLASLGTLVGLTALAIGAASQFLNLSNSIDNATNSLKEFDRVSGRMDGTNPYASPEVDRQTGVGTSRFGGGAGGDINVTVEGDADEETLRNQLHNSNYRMERTGRGI